MSYDLYLLPKETAADDPAAAYERLEEEDGQEPTAEEQVRLRQLAADGYLAYDPQLERCSIRITTPATPREFTTTSANGCSSGTAGRHALRGGSAFSPVDGASSRASLIGGRRELAASPLRRV